MSHGKQTCKILKEIRRQIAEQNNINYFTSECQFQGECKGTCPKCEAEVRYLEGELKKRFQLGKVVAVAGISLGIATSFSACHTSQPASTPTDITEPVTELVADTVAEMSPDTTPTHRQTPEISEICGIIDGEIIDPSLVSPMRYPQTPAEFPGGMEALYQFLAKTIVYPKLAVELGVPPTTILVEFIVEKNGEVSNDEINMSAVDEAFKKEILRTISLMPTWKPATQNGDPVRCFFTLPIQFSTQEEKTSDQEH